MRYIELSNGGKALLDDDSFLWLSQWRWHRSPNGYAARTGYRKGMVKILMHREVIGDMPDDLEVDHINHDRLDNRRKNLRAVTHAVNQRNCLVPRNNTSGIKGVCWDKRRHKWMAKTKHDGRHIMIGRFDDIADASRAYREYVSTLSP